MKQCFFIRNWLVFFFLVSQKVYAAESRLLDLYQFRIAGIDDLGAILVTMRSIPEDSLDRKKHLVYPTHLQKYFVSDAIEKGRFFVAIEISTGRCVGYEKFFLVKTEEERLKNLFKAENVKGFVDCTTINFLNKTVWFSDRITEFNISDFSDNLCLFSMGSEYVVHELRNLGINSTLSKTTLDSVFSSLSNLLAQKSQIGFAYCLSQFLDYDYNGGGKSRTPLLLQLFLNSLAHYFVIGNVKLYRFIEYMPTFDNDGNVVKDNSLSVQGYGNLCIINKKEE